MEQMTTKPWPFDIPPDGVVVTTTYVTQRGEPVLYVTHEYDEEEGAVWQFHCGNGDYEPAVIQLIRLDEILQIDASLYGLAGLACGFCAKRASQLQPWVITRE